VISTVVVGNPAILLLAFLLLRALSMIRFAVVPAVLLGTFLAPRAARADMGMLPNGATIEWPRLFIADDNGDFKEPADPDALRFYLNHASCTCAQQMPDRAQSKIQYELHLAATTGLQRPVIEMVGPDCVNDASRATQCRQLAETIADVDELVLTRDMTVNIYDIINNVNIKDTSGNPQPCIVDEAQPQIWAAVDTNSTTTIDMADYFSPRPIDLGKFPNDVKGFDTRPPPLPVNLDAAGSENAVTIRWDIPTANFQDLYYYQALCMDATTHEPVHSSPDSARFKTSTALCGVAETTMLTAAEVSSPTASDFPVTAVPTPFAAFDPAFVCATETSGQATSLTIDGLENGKQYIVALIAIDRSGNFTGSFFTSTVTPQAVTDLWEDIHDRGGNIEGGLCLLNETYGGDGPITDTLRAFRDDTLASTVYGRALTRMYYATLGKLGGLVHGSFALRTLAAIVLWPLVVIGLLWHLLTLPGLLLLAAAPWLWRRRAWLLRARAVRFALAAGALVAVLAPRVARADDFTPYWEDERSEASFGDEDYTVRWHAGVRVGPYTPDIDKQLGVNASTGIGPYRAMFGNYYTREGDGSLAAHDAHVYQFLPMLDVDRVIWSAFGQFAVGGSLGYMQKSAYPYLDGTSADDIFRPRSTAAKTTFRLIPFALTASYRFTRLDEDYSIPVVPYLKAGLSYYVWWMSAPSGDLSAVCKDGSMDTLNCDKNKAYGGSLGFQGTVGLAIRAERVDADAARSMQQSGIYHAGFFGELQYARVDGFGSSTKLSVGGSTWFAGVDFEF
jgi:hypothetical protein